MLSKVEDNTGELGSRTTELAEELATLATASQERHDALAGPGEHVGRLSTLAERTTPSPVPPSPT